MEPATGADAGALRAVRMPDPQIRQRTARAAGECNLNVVELLAGVHACSARQIRTDTVDPGQDNGDSIDVEPLG